MNKRYYFIIALIIAVSVTEVSVMLPIRFFSYAVSPVFILVCSLSFLLSIEEAMIWAGIQGLSIDLISPSPFGVYLISCLLLVAGIKFMQDTWFKQSSLLSVTVISLVNLSLVYSVFLGIHALVEKIGILIINPVNIVTIVSLVVGIIIQCVIVSICVRIFARTQKFTVL